MMKHYDNKGKYIKIKYIFAKRFNKKDKTKYEINISGVFTVLHIGAGFRIYGNQFGIMSIEFYFQLIFFYIGPIFGLNNDLFLNE